MKQKYKLQLSYVRSPGGDLADEGPDVLKLYLHNNQLTK